MPASHETVDKKLHYIRMTGNSVFKVAVKTMADTLDELLKEKNIDPSQISLLIPHQANERIIFSVAERLKFPKEKIFLNIAKYANTSAATIPIALTEALEENRIKKGDFVALVAFGGGFTWGSMIIKW